MCTCAQTEREGVECAGKRMRSGALGAKCAEGFALCLSAMLQRQEGTGGQTRSEQAHKRGASKHTNEERASAQAKSDQNRDFRCLPHAAAAASRARTRGALARAGKRVGWGHVGAWAPLAGGKVRMPRPGACALSTYTPHAPGGALPARRSLATGFLPPFRLPPRAALPYLSRALAPPRLRLQPHTLAPSLHQHPAHTQTRAWRRG